jgi:DNA-binding helix-hairpin-helix protein with protein kinase domain
VKPHLSRQTAEASVQTLLKAGDRLSTEISKATVVVEEILGEGAQGEIYPARLGTGRVAVKWYKPQWIKVDQGLRERLRETIRRDPPSPRFLWPMDVVVSADKPGFGYVMPYRESRFQDFSLIISGQVHASFRTLATAGLQTAEGYPHLHAKGLCYVDVSAGNIALDPDTGEVRICDCDNVDVNGRGMLSKISGTEGFMAPEIVQVQAYPTRQSDLWSLAVLLFWAFVKNHPLQGRKEYDCEVLTKADELRLWGPEALFIFDPEDKSNEPVPEYNIDALRYWQIYPEYLRALFTRAFTDGIRDPQHGRVLENEWREALAQLRDSIMTCHDCSAQNFYDGSVTHRCWNCGEPLDTLRLIVLPGGAVVMEEGAALYAHHLDARRTPDASAPIARVVRRRAEPTDLIGLENGTKDPWRVVLPLGEERSVGPGVCVGLHPKIRILMGNAEAKII